LLLCFPDTPLTDVYTLSLHDALPICRLARVTATASPQPRATIALSFGRSQRFGHDQRVAQRHRIVGADKIGAVCGGVELGGKRRDRKSTRLNSSHRTISYAVFCLKKK